MTIPCRLHASIPARCAHRWRKISLHRGLAILLAAGLSACSSSSPIPSQLSNLSTPKTLLDRALEARTLGDIGKDTDIYVQANAAMLDAGIFSLTTEIYEQRLVVTGIVNDTAKCPPLQQALGTVDGIKALYWHVLCVPRDQQKEAGAIGEFRRALLRTKANFRLFGTENVADLNLRVLFDSQRNAILLGRTRTEKERQAAIDAVAEGDGVHSVIPYVEVRP